MSEEPEEEYMSMDEVRASVKVFAREHGLQDVILLGLDGAVRRIKSNWGEEYFF